MVKYYIMCVYSLKIKLFEILHLKTQTDTINMAKNKKKTKNWSVEEFRIMFHSRDEDFHYNFV